MLRLFERERERESVCNLLVDELIKRKNMRKSFKDSLKALEADIQFANTL